MKTSKMLVPVLMAATLAATGCGDTSSAPAPSDKGKTPAKESDKKKDAKHAHGEGPNGGVIFDFGKEHAEFTVDHPAKECTILFLDGEDKDAKPFSVAAKEFTLTTKETKTKEGKVVPPMTIKMLPKDAKDGKASKFVGTDPGIANVADFEGVVLGEIDGKPAKGEFKE